MRTRHFGTILGDAALCQEWWRRWPRTGLDEAFRGWVACVLWGIASGLGWECVVRSADLPVKPALASPRAKVAVLDFEDVLHQLSIAAGVSSVSLGAGRALLKSPPAQYAEDRYQISVVQQGELLRIQLVAGGGHGFHVVREFFECPLFTRAESEALHELLSEGRDAPSRQVGRFWARTRLETMEDKLGWTLWLEPSHPRSKRTSGQSPRADRALSVTRS
jgi:hypothetical protein